MINCVYGKTMQNVWKAIKVRLVNNETTHITHKIFGKNYTAIHDIKQFCRLTNQLIWIYCSRIKQMDDVWLPLVFNKKQFDTDLLFTDTENLTYQIKSEDVYEKNFKHKH